MRCKACDKRLNAFESTRKSKVHGDYIDMCNRCFSTIADEIPVTVRNDLAEVENEDDDDTLAGDE